MATSGAIDRILTAREIVRRALQKIGVLAAREETSADDMELGIDTLNFMLKEWMADGCNLWREFSDSVVIPANTATVILDPRVVDVLDARRVVSATNEMQLARWEKGEYVSIPNKIAMGFPTCYVPTKARDSFQLTFWPVPTSDTTVKYTAARVIEDVTDEDQNVDAPQEWTSTIIENLADRLSTFYGPEFVNVVVTRRAAQLYQQMRAYDRPATYYMGTYDYGG